MGSVVDSHRVAMYWQASRQVEREGPANVRRQETVPQLDEKDHSHIYNGCNLQISAFLTLPRCKFGWNINDKPRAPTPKYKCWKVSVALVHETCSANEASKPTSGFRILVFFVLLRGSGAIWVLSLVAIIRMHSWPSFPAELQSGGYALEALRLLIWFSHYA